MTEPGKYEIEFAEFTHPLASPDAPTVLTLHLKPTAACEMFYARSGTNYPETVRLPWDRLTEALVGEEVLVPADPIPEPGWFDSFTVERVSDVLIEGKYRAVDAERSVIYRVRAKPDPRDSSVGLLQVRARRARLAPPGQRSERYMRTIRPDRLDRDEMSLTEIGDELAHVTGKKSWLRGGRVWDLVVRKKAIPAEELPWPKNIRTGKAIRGEHNVGRDKLTGYETKDIRGRRGWRVKRADFEDYLVRTYGTDIAAHHAWLRGEEPPS